MIPGLTSHLDSISQELNALLVRLYRKLKHTRIMTTIATVCISSQCPNPSQSREVSSTLWYSRRKIPMPLCRSSRKSILRQENVEEVLERSCLPIRVRQDGRAEIGLRQAALITDGDHGFINGRVEAGQGSSTTACARRFVRTLLGVWC
jgi:hypothetical protein